MTRRTIVRAAVVAFLVVIDACLHLDAVLDQRPGFVHIVHGRQAPEVRHIRALAYTPPQGQLRAEAAPWSGRSGRWGQRRRRVVRWLDARSTRCCESNRNDTTGACAATGMGS